MSYDKIILVTRKTRLADLTARFNTRKQAQFYIERAGGDFADYVREDEAYVRSLEHLHRSLDFGLKIQHVDRSFVPTFLFAPSDLIVAVGQDGLVANVAKYAGTHPIVPINPDPDRFDGVLLPFTTPTAAAAVRRTLEGSARMREITLAEARLADGQRLLAFNDLYIGARSHVSARYTIATSRETAAEPQSSSGVLVSTGAGSTGWLSSCFNMANSIAAFTGGTAGTPMQLGWDDPRLVYVVREPFASKQSRVSRVAGVISAGESLVLESRMPTGGVIFSDGVEADALAFDSGAIASITAAAQRTRLVVA